MTRTRKWATATAALVVLILLAGWFLLVSPKKASADELRVQTGAQVATNLSLRNQIKTLQAQQANAPQMRAKLATIQQQVPQTPALPPLIRSLTLAASQSGVEFESLAPVAPTGLGVTPQSAAAAGLTATGVAAANGLEQMTVSMIVQGPYASIERFVTKLEAQKRVVLVTGLTIKSEASTDVPDLSLHQATITVRVFLVPPTPAAPATGTGTTGTAPTGSTTAPVSPTTVTQ